MPTQEGDDYTGWFPASVIRRLPRGGLFHIPKLDLVRLVRLVRQETAAMMKKRGKARIPGLFF